MPTYEYRCPKGHDFEVFQRMSDEPGAVCPTCGEAAQRLLSTGAGFLFKGEGFYITDTRSESYKKAAASERQGSGEGKPTPAAADSAKETGPKKGTSSKGGGGAPAPA